MSVLNRFRESFAMEDVARNATTFIAGHAGCMAAPLLSTMTAGAVSASAGLPLALGFGALTTFGITAWQQKTQIVDCARCAAADLQMPWRHYGALALQVCLMGSLVHGYNTVTGHHATHTAYRFHTPDGRGGMVIPPPDCGNSANDKRNDTPNDTIWDRHTGGPRP